MSRRVVAVPAFFRVVAAGLGALDESPDAEAGHAKSAVCAACHGPQGLAIAPNFPNLAGQSATYLYVQLNTFKNGQRKDPVMSGQAASRCAGMSA